MRLLLSTHNGHKRREFERLLRDPAHPSERFELDVLGEGFELPPENGETFAENALEKARAAAAGLSCATLSQVILVSGLGNSWSQPLLACRPSPIVGSGRKTISSSSSCSARGTGVRARSPWMVASTGFKAVPSTTPSWTAVRQNVSKSPPSAFGFHVSRTIS